MLQVQNLAAIQGLDYLHQRKKDSTYKKIITLGGLCLFILGSIFLSIPKNMIHSFYEKYFWFGFSIDALFVLLKAFWFTDSLLYALHRYFEHLGWVSRHSAFVRQNQQYHWIHHMLIYPLNGRYMHGKTYHSVKRGITSLLWKILVGIGIGLLAIAAMGFSWQSALFMIAVAGFFQFNDITHSRFHFNNRWHQNSYYQYIAKLHILHHFDQEKNFGTTNPFMDILFGTYQSSKQLTPLIEICLKSQTINLSDFINFSYLIEQSRTLEDAIFISGALQFPGERKKIQAMLNSLKQVDESTPYYQEASFLAIQLERYLNLIPMSSRMSTTQPSNSFIN